MHNCSQSFVLLIARPRCIVFYVESEGVQPAVPTAGLCFRCNEKYSVRVRASKSSEVPLGVLSRHNGSWMLMLILTMPLRLHMLFLCCQLPVEMMQFTTSRF